LLPIFRELLKKKACVITTEAKKIMNNPGLTAKIADWIVENIVNSS
jgi:hypothetical protein